MESLAGADEDTAELIIQMQLDDLEQQYRELYYLPRTSKIHDTLVANLNMANELLRLRTHRADRRLARSITRAVVRDGDMVTAHSQQEEQARRDHEVAQTLDQGVSFPNTKSISR